MQHGRDDEQHDHLTPLGQVEQVGALARGLRTNAAGRRRALRLLLGLVLAVAVLAVVVVLLER